MRAFGFQEEANVNNISALIVKKRRDIRYLIQLGCHASSVWFLIRIDPGFYSNFASSSKDPCPLFALRSWLCCSLPL